MRGLLVLVIACSSSHDKSGATWAAEAEGAYNGWNGTPMDLATSFAAAEKACALEDANGCTLLGLHYQDGRGAPWDHAAAIFTYEKACRLGSGTGCYNLESMYLGGHGVVVDVAAGKRYREQARAAWNAACYGSAPRWCTNLAFLEFDAEAPDHAKILQLDQRACDAGVLVGCSQAAREQVESHVLAPATYLARLDELCAKGEVGACGIAASALLTGEDGVTRDEAAGETRMAAACDQHGDPASCFQAGLVEEKQARLDGEIDCHYLAACDRGFGKGCLAIASRWHSSKPTEAVRFAERGCMIGLVHGCAWAAASYRDGVGVAKDPKENARWLREACSMGDATSCAELIGLGIEPPVPADQRATIRAEACAAGVAAACAK